ncbi:IS66 family insertion sequence element accessory protein TnpB [Bradyrhizobium vignae]|uniref:IS66 family insertion sequence element accessory protein TnpB n=1 Tax=Bradyrhizobium vignae TaxID=1549949 RepID=A0ABS4A0E4_9BRAD|nr:IS66 family insertion sequence element accessory protein TnpB [Bradyrhizobium vignae]
MSPIPSGVRVWIATGHTDMRRGMRSLALTVQESLKRDPDAGDLYISGAAAAIWSRFFGMMDWACRSMPTVSSPAPRSIVVPFVAAIAPVTVSTSLPMGIVNSRLTSPANLRGWPSGESAGVS